MKKIRLKTYIYLSVSLIALIVGIIFSSIKISSWKDYTFSTFFYISLVLCIIFVILDEYFYFKGVLKVSNDDALFFRPTKQDRPKETISSWIAFLTGSFALILFVFAFFIVPGQVEQSSMTPTLLSSNRVLINHFNYTPKRGDIVVLELKKDEYSDYPQLQFDSTSAKLVKRIYALPNDKVEFVESYYIDQYNPEVDKMYFVIVNGVISGHKNSRGDMIYHLVSSAVVSNYYNKYLDSESRLISGYYMIFGDNAANSVDSRVFGPVTRDKILGNVIFKLSPFGKIND